MSFLIYDQLQKPKPGESAFPADFGSKAAIERADAVTGRQQSLMIAERKARRMVSTASREMLREARNSRDPQQLQSAVDFMRNNSWAFGMRNVNDTKNSATEALRQIQWNENKMAQEQAVPLSQRGKDGSMTQDQQAAVELVTKDKFGLTGQDRNNELNFQSKEVFNQAARERRLPELQSYFRSIAGQTPPALSPTGTQGQQGTNGEFGWIPYWSQDRTDPAGMVDPTTGAIKNALAFTPAGWRGRVGNSSIDQGRFVGAFAKFKTAYDANPSLLGPLRRQLLDAHVKRPDMAMDVANWADRAPNIIDAVMRNKAKLGIQITKDTQVDVKKLMEWADILRKNDMLDFTDHAVPTPTGQPLSQAALTGRPGDSNRPVLKAEPLSYASRVASRKSHKPNR